MGGTGRSFIQKTDLIGKILAKNKETRYAVPIATGIAGGLLGPYGAAGGAALGEGIMSAHEGRSNRTILGRSALAGAAGYAGATGLESMGAGGTAVGASGASGTGAGVALSNVGVAPGEMLLGAGGGGITGGQALGGIMAANVASQYYGAKQEQEAAEERYEDQQRDILAAERRQQQYITEAEQREMANIGEAQKRASETWQETGFPQEEKIAAAKSASMADINRRTEASRRAFMESMAARGITGGGVLSAGLGDIERERQRNYAQLASELTQFQNTPYSAPPVITGYPGEAFSRTSYATQQPYTTFGQRMADMGEDVTGTMGGIYAYDWLRNR